MYEVFQIYRGLKSTPMQRTAKDQLLLQLANRDTVVFLKLFFKPLLY